MRLAVILATVLALPWLGAGSAEATDALLRRSPHRAPPAARTLPVLRAGDSTLDRDDRGHGPGRGDHGGHRPRPHHRPGVILVAPYRCWQPGFWTHQWVPQAYTYGTWVAGHWSPDGRWVEGHYVPYVHHAGYYRQVWVEGYWTAC